MSRRRIWDNVNVDPKNRDITNWPIVNIMQLNPEDRLVFKKEKRQLSYICSHNLH